MELLMETSALVVVRSPFYRLRQLRTVQPFPEIALIILPRNRDGDVAGSFVDHSLQARLPKAVRADGFDDLLMNGHGKLLPWWSRAARRASFSWVTDANNMYEELL